MNLFYKRLATLFFVLIILFFPAIAQTITTADNFFTSVSERYGTIEDYTANIYITSSEDKSSAMSGTLIFKKPDLLRIDFTRPAEQTIVFDGTLLTIYLPANNVTLKQSVEKSSGTSGASLATPQGLSLLKRYYSIAYETGPEPEPISEDSEETAIILLLSRRSTTELFRRIRLFISDETRLIRKIEGQTVSGEQIVFEFSNYSINKGIHITSFEYDSPPTSNNYNNFLFSE